MKSQSLSASGKRGWSVGLCLSVILLSGLPARPAAAVSIQPYVQLSATPSTITIDAATGVGNYDTPITVKVAANTIYGGISISSSPLILSTDSSVTIPAAQLEIKGPLTGSTFTPLGNAVNITGPMMPGVFTIPLTLRYAMPSLQLAGTYNGTVTVTVAGAP